ncbi:MAG: hypothetical protein LBH98_05045 [Chitinispirillales bacterium]|jgi:hypothetical protein|nr:hypothetical protein [Chitinispirillales bacterium]
MACPCRSVKGCACPSVNCINFGGALAGIAVGYISGLVTGASIIAY